MTEGAVLACIFLVLSTFFFITPFLSGKNMITLGTPTTPLVKGEDDLMRILQFALGLCMSLGSLVM